MYADDPLVLELLALLKAHGVRHVVIAPGSRHYAFTRSFENDDYFSLYSVVDERSAGFFALGLIQATGEPVATLCTSGTASINFGSAVAEAFYQKLPLVVVTTDRLPEFLGQMEDQMFEQKQLFEGFVRYTGQLTAIHGPRGKWYCNRIINEALIACRRDGGGPVHINAPYENHTNVTFGTSRLPDSRVIRHHALSGGAFSFEPFAERLRRKKVMLLWGQTARPGIEALQALDRFTETFDCVVLADHLSNLHHPARVEDPLSYLSSTAPHSGGARPDIVISLGGNFVFNNEIKAYLRASEVEHWRIDPDGEVADPFWTLTDVFAMDPFHVLGEIAMSATQVSEGRYRQRVIAAAETLSGPPSTETEMGVIGEFLAAIPAGSALHVSNSASARMVQFYDIDESIDVFCNRGVNGIDGCMSTAVGYAAATRRPTFLIIGDLTFFYDMNALWIRHRPENLRILLLNNEGGAIMHSPLPHSYNEQAARHVTAGHSASAQGWIESTGMRYERASTTEEIRQGIAELTDLSGGGAMALEVFTEKVSDITVLNGYYRQLAEGTGARRLKIRLRKFAGRVLRRLGLRK